MKRSLSIIFLVLLLDQAVKIWIKTHMFLGQEFMCSAIGLSFILQRTTVWHSAMSLAVSSEASAQPFPYSFWLQELDGMSFT